MSERIEERDMDLYFAYQARNETIVQRDKYKGLFILMMVIFVVVAVVVTLVLLVKLKPKWI